MDKYYVTTPIYYVNDVPHIGHAYSTIAADVLARFYRVTLGGKNVLFLTGTDEHGQKVSRAADSRGLSPQEHVDDMVKPFKKLWKQLDISYNDFLRTTQKRHEKVVQDIFQKIHDKGDIYKGTYEGWYCIYEETFYPESQLKDGKCCPECGRETEWVEEESYFFKLSKYKTKLLDLITKGDLKIRPESRQNEVTSFLKGEVQDISVSRTGFEWGTLVPFDKKHVVYVWFDALINYVSGAGFLEDDKKFDKFWPADVHIIGKDILKFHAVIWPAMLLALGIQLPKMIFAHGFLTLGEEKISKSKGIVVDPIALIERFGADAYRYFFMSEFSFGLDGEYTEETLIKRINSDLANDLGNLVHRTANMMNKYFEGTVPTPPKWNKTIFITDKTAIDIVMPGILNHYKNLEFKQILQFIWDMIKFLNAHIEEKAPWRLYNDPNKELLNDAMYSLSDGLRIISQLIYPFMPKASQKIWEQIGMEGYVSEQPFEDITRWGLLKPGSHFKVAKPLFPRIED